MSNVSRNLNNVKEKIRLACLKRTPELQNYSPRLVAVSKLKPKELIIEAYEEGQIHFGENYVQELLEKGNDPEILSKCPEIKWHFIGHLQRKNVNKLLNVPNLFIVETVDSEKLATALDVRLKSKGTDCKLNIFVQVNTSGEEAKSGCTPEESLKLVKFIIQDCSNLTFKGLMTIGKFDNYNLAEQINPDFKCLIDCRSQICSELGLDVNECELSMGMSADFEHAIQVGSTNVRVGSSIFGHRS